MAVQALVAGAAGLGSLLFGEASKWKYDENMIDKGNFKMEGPSGYFYHNKSTLQQNRGGVQLNTAQQNDWRQNQQNLASMLQAQAAGTAPSAAQLQLAAGQQRNVAAATSLARSMDGVSPAMALRSAQEAQVASNTQTQQQMAQMRAQEQAAGQQALTGMLSGARQQDIGLATQQAGLDVTQRQMNDQMTQFYEQQGFSRDQARLQANMALEQQKYQYQALAAGAAANQQQFMAQLAGAGASALGAVASGAGAAMASDRRVKKNIKHSKKELDAVMAGLKSYTYDYKNPDKHGHGKQFGVMAQDLIKTNLGKPFVEKTEDGTLQVNYGKNLSTMMSMIARLNERVSDVEGKGK